MITCKSCRSDFEDSAQDQEFRQRLSPKFAGVSLELAPPTLCPTCRRLRRASYCNDFKYYRRNCDLCATQIISVHHQSAPFPVYCSRCWWSDEWKRDGYFQEVDFSRTFFEQFYELRRNVPQLAMINDDGSQSENCEYCQNFAFGKNCYLTVGSWNDQDCLYSNESGYCREVVDADYVNLECELVYESNSCTHLYRCAFLSSSTNCSDCWFGYDLKSCSQCYGCIGLRNQRLHLFNKAVSLDEYHQFIEGAGRLTSQAALEKMKLRYAEFSGQFPKRAVAQIACENCQGDGLFQCKNTLGFRLFSAEDCRYFFNGDSPKCCQDVDVSGKCEWCYECNSPDESYQCLFTNSSWRNRDVILSDQCYSSKSLLGCVGMHRAEHRIFNKAYSAHDYETLAEKIISKMQSDSEWGEFFPPQHSFFAYNESRAYEILPRSAAQVAEIGLQWRDLDKTTQKQVFLPLPDDINETREEHCKQFVECSICSRPYKLIPQELKFLQKMQLASPRACPDCRRRRRANLRPPLLHDRHCSGCNAAVQSIFGNVQEPRVLCEPCALKFDFQPIPQA